MSTYYVRLIGLTPPPLNLPVDPPVYCTVHEIAFLALAIIDKLFTWIPTAGRQVVDIAVSLHTGAYTFALYR